MGNRASPVIVAALLLGALALFGQFVSSTARAGERVALVIGNASYKESPLRNPINDARAMAASLKDLGFEVISVENAGKETMERAIVEFTGRLDENSSGLFYYAGHGVQISGRNYLVPVDARIRSEREARIESVGVSLVLDELEYAGNRLNVVILDSCRNNPFERRLRGASRGLAAIDAGHGTLIAYATSPGSVALDGDGRNGLYTEELLRALRVPGLEVEEVFKQVRVQVSRRTDNQQIPWESSSLTGRFILNRPSPTASTTSSTENRNETLYWESVERNGTPEAYRAYLQQFPNGVFSSLAALRIDELMGKAAGSGGAPTATSSGSQTLVATLGVATVGVTEKSQPGPLRVAILPFASSEKIIFSPVEKELIAFSQDFVKGQRDLKLAYSYYSSQFDSKAIDDPESYWSGGFDAKEPIESRVYAVRDQLNVDAVLMYHYRPLHPPRWAQQSYEADVYVFNLWQKRLYRNSSDEAQIQEATRQAFEELVREK